MKKLKKMQRTLWCAKILPLCLMLFVGCARTGNDIPFQEGVDLVWLQEGDKLKAPAKGAFLSEKFYQFQFDRCVK